MGRKLQLFLPLVFNTPFGVFPLEFREKRIPGKGLDLRKLESWGYQAVKTV